MPKTSMARSNAKWDDDANIKFIDLCENEIRQGRRPHTHLNRDGWNNVVEEFNKDTGRNYDKKQMKNHWANMKKDWILFKKLMRGETGLGWDATKNTIMADDDWWEQKIKEDDRYNKFRKIDLSLMWYRYDALFSDIVATGERARTANQEQMSGIGVDLDEEGINDIGGYDKEHFINPNDEANNENDDIQNVDSIMFPKSSLKRRGLIDGIGTNTQVKKKKKKKNKAKSGAASVREDIHSLVDFMSSKSTATSPSIDDPVIDKCMNVLANFSNIPAGSGKYNYVYNMFLKKDVRQLFLKMETDEAQKSWLEYNSQLYLEKIG
ncbi:L10-interacting MYB domain-containing protein-like [Lycium ferocissimum]|uniref:L10-interacting MYB domain-containing protein-like n=1 Tax=Lycium ferocissimum TaxID=112874 RepID=UPI00281618C7|nr:L10-interacting MYB domain-containing protein-like [Lycium ferocissimum]